MAEHAKGRRESGDRGKEDAVEKTPVAEPVAVGDAEPKAQRVDVGRDGAEDAKEEHPGCVRLRPEVRTRGDPCDAVSDDGGQGYSFIACAASGAEFAVTLKVREIQDDGLSAGLRREIKLVVPFVVIEAIVFLPAVENAVQV